MPSPGGRVYADELDALINRRVCRLRQTAAQALADNTAVAVSFGAGSEEIDTHGMHNEAVNPTRITIDKAGVYDCRGGVMFATQTTPVVSAAYIRISGTGLATGGRWQPPNHIVSLNTFAVAELDVGDYVELIAQQDSAGAANTSVSSFFSSSLEVIYLRGPI